jgi:nucleoside-diphosphate-sugar epimerase
MTMQYHCNPRTTVCPHMWASGCFQLTEKVFSDVSGNPDSEVIPPSVHGDGDHGFVPFLIRIAREKGVSAYVGDGLNRWSAVHRLDAARLYRLVLENGSDARRYHAVADEGVPFREIAHVIGRRLNVPVVRKSEEEAADHFGWFAHFAGLDCPALSAQTRQRLAWHPTHPSLIPDIDRPEYFEMQQKTSDQR